LVEEFPTVSSNPDHPDYALALLTPGSVLVRAALHSSSPGAIAPGEGTLEGGIAQAQTARPEIEAALARLERVDHVNILCAPDQGRDVSIAASMVSQCERLGDRFAVLQGAESWTTPNQFELSISPSNFAAVYHPWLCVRGPGPSDTCFVPPSGPVAGIYARVDTSRGVHTAPANRAVKGLALPETGLPLGQQIDHARQEVFNVANVNIIRDFRAQGRGIRVYGARTYGADPEWRYVSVRRLLMFIEESIDEGTQWVVFEPNDDTTHANVRRLVADFLLGIWRSGGLVGRTADEAFFVKCGRDTMTQADIDAGRLICLVGVAPMKPAEFVVFRISQMTREAEASI
jgi:phage tail sheath protein FI